MTFFPSSLSHFLRALSVAAAMLAVSSSLHAAPDQPAKCEYIQLASLPLRYTGPSLDLTIAGSIDGAPADMLVDTGSNFTMLTEAAAVRRGLMLSPSRESMRGPGGRVRMYSARVREFRAGPAAVFNDSIRVMGEFGHPLAYDARLGAQFLLQSDLELSLATKELRFFKPSNCKDAILAYWDANAVEIPFARSYSANPNPVFKVTLNGKELTAAIDTGAVITMMTRRAAERIGLKMDAPGVDRVGDAVGVGSHRMARWSTTIDTLQIGREIIRNAEIGVVDADDTAADLLLGTDFLRSHRVLIAMSQSKLYVSYVGGEALGQLRRIEPWLLQEAEAGNGDAQLTVGMMHSRGHGTARDPVQARAWIDRAAASGNPRAQLLRGQRLRHDGHYAEAAGVLRAALDRLPAERFGALWLYVARMRSGDTDLARRELDTTFARDDAAHWPRPIADYYLGKIDEDRLLTLARKDSAAARSRTCYAKQFIVEGHRIAGDEERAKLVIEQASECRPAATPTAQATL